MGLIRSEAIPIAILVAVTFTSCLSSTSSNVGTAAGEIIPAKELFIPAKIHRIPENNNYDCPESDYSFSRMVESDNVAVLWYKEYGDDPMVNPNESKRFDVDLVLSECERFYRYYVDELKMVEKGQSLSDRYKLLVFIFGGDEGTAYGGGAEDKIGAIWTNASRINKYPYGVLAHEMAHSFQFLSRLDAGIGPRGPIMEMSAQLLLWQVYPDWMTFENYHLVDYLKKTHCAFLHPTNMYHSPYVLEYWQHRHGNDFFGRLSRETLEDEDPETTYKRLNNLTQEQFNDEMFDAARRFITWDMARIDEVARPYANMHHTVLTHAGDGWYRIDSMNCPQNYGYNGIRLEVPSPRARITLQFKGIAGAEGYNDVKTDKAGWRYGFVASLGNGKRVYSPMFSNAEATVTFRVPKHTEHLWLVVSGAPTEHWPVAMRRGSSPSNNPEEQWPYQIKLTGTVLDSTAIN